MTEPQRISPEEAKRRLDAGEPVVFLDSRSPAAWQQAAFEIPHSIRVPPDEVARHAAAIPRTGLIVPYCT